MWSARWNSLASLIASEEIDWRYFRASLSFHLGIETHINQLPAWLERARELAVPPEYLPDSMVGQPSSLGGITATSVRHAICAHRIASRWERASVRVLEIGGGFGGFAHALSRRFDIIAYYMVDHPAMQLVQKKFLEQAAPELNVFFIDNISELDEIELVVNLNSFGEMPPSEVRRYFGSIQKVVVLGGAFYTVNKLNRETCFKWYPYDSHWTHHRDVFMGDPNWVEQLSIRTLSSATHST